MELQQARELAGRWVELLRPYCERIEIAGSVRRLKPDVKDIEIVAAPRVETLVAGTTFSDVPELLPLQRIDFKLNKLLVFLDRGEIPGRKVKGGERYWQIRMKEGINLDLFMVLPPAQWGIIFTIRTGPADFSHWIVTTRRKGGALPSYARVSEGQLFQGDEAVPMPEEIDFLNFLGLGWIEPEKREAEILRCAGVDSQRPGAYTVTHHEQEPGSSGKDSAQATNAKLSLAGFEAHFETVTGDKVVRAGPWSSSCEAGKVRLVRGGWNEAFIEEHLAFPMGRLKDQVDASSGAHAKLVGDLVLEGQLLY